MPQYAFQRRQINPGDRVINIGCDIDCGLLRHDFGAFNVDVNRFSASNNHETAADFIHDARVPFPFRAEFDVAILGDLLEHFSDNCAVMAIRNAAAILKTTGLLVITCPEDYRPQSEQGEYAEHCPGVPKHHPRPITIEIIGKWLFTAGLNMASVQQIEYGFCQGWGVTARKPVHKDGATECQ